MEVDEETQDHVRETLQRNTLRCKLGCSCTWKGPPTPQKMESIFSVFFAALNSAVIDTVMGQANLHIDSRLMSCYASLYRAS